MPDPEAHTSVASEQTTLMPRLLKVRFGGLIETVGVLWIYLIYSQLRAMAAGSPQPAFENAWRIARLEQFFGFSFERSVQELALRVEWIVGFANVWYGTIHFIAPIAVLIFLWHKAPTCYVRMRNALLITFALGTILFFAFPVMPPRLMPSSYHFVDTGRDFFHINGGIGGQLGGSYQPTTSDFAQGANDYAAMPSMHVAWSTWVALALWPLARRRRMLQALLVAYPLSILLCVTLTGNHWFLDAIGAWTVLVLSYGLSLALERWLIARRAPAPSYVAPAPS